MKKQQPKVIIAGGGPGGLMAAILLSQKGIPTTILEQSHEPETWSQKSYSISINERGIAALERANCLELVKEIGIENDSIGLFDGIKGTVTPLPLKKARPSIRLDRPSLCKVLESILEDQTDVNLRRGSPVQKVVTIPSSSPLNSDENLVEVHLEDGSVISATHVIGADGKWSNVRKSCPYLESQVRVETEGSFGVQMNRDEIPEGWSDKLMYVTRPKDGTFYIMGIPLINKKFSLMMVCFDEVSKKNTWLVPRGEAETGWDDSITETQSDSTTIDLIPKLKEMLEKEVPAYLSAVGDDTLNSVTIRRRPQWINFSTHDGKPGNYCTQDGRVTLIGDAAHAVVPSTGEGCNMALESAMRLADSINFEKGGEAPLTVEVLSSGFKAYGLSRPHETLPVQLAAAAAANYETTRMR